MDLQIKLFLLISTPALCIADVRSYVPGLTLSSIAGKVTATTFVLEKPQCIFNAYSTYNVSLVVARSNVTPQLTEELLGTLVPYLSFSQKGYYHTLLQPASKYPCSNTLEFIQVGSDVSGTDITFRNGPLTFPGPYRVKFVVLNNTGMITSTQWSEAINLLKGKNSSTIDVWPGRRSGGMIVITSILSILLAILMTCFVAALIVGSKILVKKEPFQAPATEVIDMKNYKTHYASTRNHENTVTKTV